MKKTKTLIRKLKILELLLVRTEKEAQKNKNLFSNEEKVY